MRFGFILPSIVALLSLSFVGFCQPRSIAELQAEINAWPDSGIFHQVWPTQNLATSIVEPIAMIGFQPDPAYPDSAKKHGIRAVVTMQVCVNSSGIVHRWRCTAASPPDWGFEQEVDKVIGNWRFTPGTVNGEPAERCIAMAFTFKPGRTTPMMPEEIVLRKYNSLKSFRKTKDDFLRIHIEGRLAPSEPMGSGLELVHRFIEEYRDILSLSSLNSEIGFRSKESAWRLSSDSVETPVYRDIRVQYLMQQYYCGVPVLSSHFIVDVLRREQKISSIDMAIVTDIDVDYTPTVSVQRAIELNPTLFEGPDRHCQADNPILCVARIDSCDHLVWKFDLACGPDVGFHWGEEAWVDAHSGEVIKDDHTWIE